MVDELEPGPDPRKVRDPRSRRPAGPPARVPDILRSYTEDRAFSIRRNTEAEALVVKAELKAANYYLRKWEGYNIRVAPYVTQHWEDGAGEHTVLKGQTAPAGAKVYYKTNFWVYPPKEQGFRTTDASVAEGVRRQALEARGIVPIAERPAEGPRHRRTVQRRANLRGLVQTPRSVITQEEPRGIRWMPRGSLSFWGHYIRCL